MLPERLGQARLILKVLGESPITVTTGEHERNVARQKLFSNGIDLAAADTHVEDRGVQWLLVCQPQRGIKPTHRAHDLATETLQHFLDQNGDQHLVFDNRCFEQTRGSSVTPRWRKTDSNSQSHVDD